MNGIFRALFNTMITILLVTVTLDSSGYTDFLIELPQWWVWIVIFIAWVVVNWDEKPQRKA